MRLSTQHLLAPALALLLTGPALAQQQTRPQPGFVQRPFFQNPAVRQSMNITDQQFNRLNDAATRLQTRFRTDFSRLGDLNDAERAARLQTMNRDFRSGLLRSAGDILDERQVNRFRQLDLQSRGIDAFADLDVQRRLNLSDLQIRRFGDLRDRSDRQLNQFRDLARTNRDDAMRRFQEFNRTLLEERNRILTPEQQRSWQDFIGQPFDFQPDFATPLPDQPNNR